MTRIEISRKVAYLIREYAKNLSEFTERESTGRQFETECYRMISSLVDNPKRFRLYDKKNNLRELIVNNHIILYHFDEKDDVVYVLNIKNAKQLDYR